MQPIIYAGGGVITSDAGKGTKNSCRENRYSCYFDILLGLGGFRVDHPLFLGMLGMRNQVCKLCDNGN